MPPVREGSEAELKHDWFQQVLGKHVGFNKQLISINSNSETNINKSRLMDGNGQTLLLLLVGGGFVHSFSYFILL